MKKLLSVILLSLFLLNIGGFYLYFDVMKYENRQGMERAVKDNDGSDLTVLAIPVAVANHNSSVFQRTDKDEIRYKGKMYDVAKEVHHHNTILFYCVHDTHEDQLNDELDRQVANNAVNIPLNTPGNNKDQPGPLKNLIKEYLPNQKDISFTIPSSRRIYRERHLFYDAVCPDVDAPPPRNIIS